MIDSTEKLLLITDNYPYGSGETFIESEIIFLSQFFKEVLILSLNAKPIEKCRNIPQNCRLIFFNEKNKIGYWSVMVNMLQQRYILIEFLSNLISNPLKNKVLTKSLGNALEIKAILNKTINSSTLSNFVFYSYWLNDAAIALSLLRIPGTKISRAHGWDIYRERHLYNYLPLRRHLARKLDGIYSISENGRKELSKQTGCKNIFVSRLGTENTYPINISDANFSNPLIIISIGNAIPLKRLYLIGEAIKCMDSEKIQWIHFGDGPLLQKLKKDFPFGNFKGQVSNAEIKEQLNIYKDNALLINTSTSEGIPVSMMEAMSFGIPCIGTDVGGVSEIIVNNYNGFLLSCEPSKIDLKNVIASYFELTMAEKLNLRIKARSTWEKFYNAEKNYGEFIRKVF